MKRTYIYKHHEGFDIYLSLRKLSEEECYCPICQESDTLLFICDNIESLSNTLKSLLGDYELMDYYADKNLVDIMKEVAEYEQRNH